ncbi:hypothetical protein KFK09_009218 [Dendrobium nobile]|uniref:Integrase catalytic domain-containing protein n=1 Tax=Dendrobium nobile TaxID=94219 RepID=A0A8T3BMS1_DENNO|nr:hypothetical protein KFK09_009218 [Dendrobium nobile]
MAGEESVDSRRNTSTVANGKETDLLIPPHLKFLISNIKNLVPTTLTTENYSIWRLQLFQHFSANGYGEHLTGQAECPPESEESAHSRWVLIDRNLVSALLSTISPSILPYVIMLRTSHDVWTTLEHRLQPKNRSRVIQLKNELHQIQMRDRTMLQYLDQIKKLVDNIAAAGSTVDTEDIVLYILNGLPATYNSFKTAIRTSLQPINLDELYSLLSSEEINLQHQQFQENQNSDSTSICISCNMSKHHKLSFSSSKSVCNKSFQLVHSDVWGPAPSLLLNGYRFYVIFIDDYTRYSWLYLLHSKNEVFNTFQHLCSLIKSQFHSKIQTLRSDGGGEFTSQAFWSYLAQHGINQQISCPYTPEQNGIAERKHRHLIELTRTLLHSASLPNSFWGDVVSTANYLINRLPSSTIRDQTPYFRLHGKQASYEHLRTFGCICFP